MKEIFKITGEKPKGVTCNAFLRAIRRDHPELASETAYFPHQGIFGYTAMIGDLVFKALRLDNIPEERRESGPAFRKTAFEREIKILRHLKGKGLPVPEFMGERHDPRYLIMSRKRGIRLEQEKLDEMTLQERRQLAKDLGGFMAGLSKSVSAQEAKDMGFRSDLELEHTNPEKLKDLLDDPAMAKELGDNFDFCRRMQIEFAGKYEDYLNEPAVFSHGDLHTGNILYNPATKRIDGKVGCVIDLGLCRYRKPAQESATLLFSYKPDFVAMVWDEYTKLTGQKLSFRDVIIRCCAVRIDHVKQSLESKNPDLLNHSNLLNLPKLLEEIAAMKKFLAADVQAAGSKKTSPQKPHETLSG